MVKSLSVIMVFIIAMTLLNCNEKNANSDEITIQFLKAEFDAGKDFYLLDVRTLPEYTAGHLSFTDDLIAYDQLAQHLDKIPQDKSTTMYIFCRTSRRSGIATSYLRSIGYPNVYNVLGGIVAWQNAGFEIVSGN